MTTTAGLDGTAGILILLFLCAVAIGFSIILILLWAYDKMKARHKGKYRRSNKTEEEDE